MKATFYNSLVEGDFGEGLLLCQSLVEGDFWSRCLGCCTIHRGQGHIDDVDYSRIIAVGSTTGSVTLPGHITHQVDTDYFYAARRVSPTGKSERGTMAVVRLSLDEQGEQRVARANRVCNLVAEAAEQGKIRLKWWYWSLGQSERCDHFAVYGDNGTGSIDYENVLAEIEYRGEHCYSYLSEAGDDGKRYQFSVRSVTEDGSDDGNRRAVSAAVDLTGPGGIEDIICEVGF